MESARLFYRYPLVEIFLLSCVIFQIGSGSWFVFKGWKSRKGRVPWLQAASGAYLAFFLLVHVAAVLIGRLLLDLDTNFHFAAAGFHVEPYIFFFAPYYFLAVLAFFTHLGCAAYWGFNASSIKVRKGVIVGATLAGSAISFLIVLSLAGYIHPVEIPTKYKATYVHATS